MRWIKPNCLLLLGDSSLDYKDATSSHSFKSPETFKSFFSNRHRPKNGVLILDLTSLTYVLDEIPTLSFLDRRGLIQRRSQKHLKNSLFKGNYSYSKNQIGLVGISPTSSLLEWVHVLNELKFPLSRITITALELNTFIPEAPWTLISYQTQEGIHRHSLLRDNKLLFTRVTHSASTLLSDMESTLTYAQRFNLPKEGGQVVYVGKSSFQFPPYLRNIPIHVLYPDSSFEESFLQNKWETPRFSFQLKMRSTLLWKNWLFHKILFWLRQFGLLYSAVAVGVACYLFVIGTTYHLKIQEAEKSLFSLRATLSYIHKTHPQIVENAVLYVAHNRFNQSTPDLLKVLGKVAHHKAAHFLVTRLKWQQVPDASPILEVYVTSHSLNNKEDYKAFVRSIQKAFPNATLETDENETHDAQILLSVEPEVSPRDASLHQGYSLKIIGAGL